MKLPTPPAAYDMRTESRRNAELEREDRRNRKTDVDVEIAAGQRLILRSPNGTRYSITVSNTGVISATAI